MAGRSLDQVEGEGAAVDEGRCRLPRPRRGDRVRFGSIGGVEDLPRAEIGMELGDAGSGSGATGRGERGAPGSCGRCVPGSVIG